MNQRKLAVLGILATLVVVFVAGLFAYQQHRRQATDEGAAAAGDRLVRMHSSVLGPQNAPVTIVEFFDPACETCRAIYPFIKEIMARHPQDVRLVIRYAPFHPGSDQVVKLLEAAKRQGRYLLVLEAVLQAQPLWADHASPRVDLAYQAAERAGLDMARARQDIDDPAMAALLRQDVEDLKALQVRATPTFFVNGRSLSSFGPDPLAQLVAEEVAKVRR
ncbi:MAG: disulfide bond formation protein DsbA [Burkholderiaceae bacterium]|jgi:protein-disulfide isomerase|nr:MAG: disulfide bond formation protein DsbA [Burkholderiaceae bacterium]